MLKIETSILHLHIWRFTIQSLNIDMMGPHLNKLYSPIILLLYNYYFIILLP